MIKKNIFGWISVLILMLASTTGYASCGSALCPFNTQLGLQSYSNSKENQLDLHAEWIDQDQPQTKTDHLTVGEITRHHDEVRTINRNTVLTFDHAWNKQWAVSVSLPWRSVAHDHIHNHHQGTEHIPEHWSFNDVGDIRVLGRYQRVQNMGLLGGIKLPTGSFSVENDEGDVAERSLQPGSGTTDVLLGAFYQQHDIRSPHSWFAQILLQESLNTRDGFKSGRTVKLDGGVQYAASSQWSVLAQVNTVIRARDQGDEAEPEDTGSQAIYFSPGVSFLVMPRIQLYSFFQQPIYQNVHGVQLVADYSFILGIKSSF